MLMRKKFVTNSSSSCYVVYGIEMDGKQLDNVLRLLCKQNPEKARKFVKDDSTNNNQEMVFDLEEQFVEAANDYLWVILLVALAIGTGTLFGWKRVVITVGERIGKKPLTYAQGMSAELIAAMTIGVAAVSGMPVSTTHVLSSGVAGTMTTNGVGMNLRTVKDIITAWLLTFPISVLLSGTLFLLFSLIP